MVKAERAIFLASSTLLSSSQFPSFLSSQLGKLTEVKTET